MSAERMEELRRMVVQAVEDTSLRKVGRKVGVSHGTIDNFRAGGAADDRTVQKLELWAAGMIDKKDEKDGRAGETWPDYLTEVLVREARAAEKRAEAAASWARWLEKEADGREATREEVERFRRAEYDRLHPPTVAPVIPGERETAEEKKRTA